MIKIEATQYQTRHTKRIEALRHYTLAAMAGMVLTIIFYVWASVPVGGV